MGMKIGGLIKKLEEFEAVNVENILIGLNKEELKLIIYALNNGWNLSQ